MLFLLLGWLLFGIDRGAAWGFTSPWVLASFAATALSAWWFVRVERAQAEVMGDPGGVAG